MVRLGKSTPPGGLSRGVTTATRSSYNLGTTCSVGFKRMWIRIDAQLMVVECLCCGFRFACQVLDVAEVVCSVHAARHASGREGGTIGDGGLSELR
jgi:hypothetical protein